MKEPGPTCCIIPESVAGKTGTSLVPSLEYTSSDNSGLPTRTCVHLPGEERESPCGLHWLTSEPFLSPPRVLVLIIDLEPDFPFGRMPFPSTECPVHPQIAARRGRLWGGVKGSGGRREKTVLDAVFRSHLPTFPSVPPLRRPRSTA